MYVEKINSFLKYSIEVITLTPGIGIVYCLENFHIN
jgi:outer membrane scaffolding protein for murein synthesis (MipA/OmpV family)